MGWSPEFFVNSRRPDSGERVSFSRLNGGRDDGSVMVAYYRDEKQVGAVLIDTAGWASVLAHVSAVPHDGETFAAMRAVHAGDLPNHIRKLKQGG